MSCWRSAINHTFDYDTLRRRADEYAPDGPIQSIPPAAIPGEIADHARRRDPQSWSRTPFLVTDPAWQPVHPAASWVAGKRDPARKRATSCCWRRPGDFISIRRRSHCPRPPPHRGPPTVFSRGVHPARPCWRNGPQNLLAVGEPWRGASTTPTPTAPRRFVGDLDPVCARKLSA